MTHQNSSQPKPAMPTREEIIAQLDKHTGVVDAYRVFTEKYGPPKNAWGSLFRLVMRERKNSSNATIRTSINGNNNAAANAQSNALDSVASSNSGSKTANVVERSTPNVPMVIVREPDAIIQSQDQLPAEATYQDSVEDIQNYLVSDPGFWPLARPSQAQYPRAASPRKREPDFLEYMPMLIREIVRLKLQMQPALMFLRALSQN